MAASNQLPHDRGHLLWTAEDGPSRMLLSSMDRWISTILVDDGLKCRLWAAMTRQLLRLSPKGMA